MKPTVARFLIVAVVFVGLMAYQGYLAMTVSNPVIVSRPQVMVSDVSIFAKLDKKPTGSTKVQVQEVYGPQEESAGKRTLLQAKDEITITNLQDATGWQGPGTYLIPLNLVSKESSEYEVAEVPYSPGYDPVAQADKRFRIYFADSDRTDVEAQLGSVASPKK